MTVPSQRYWGSYGAWMNNSANEDCSRIATFGKCWAQGPGNLTITIVSHKVKNPGSFFYLADTVCTIDSGDEYRFGKGYYYWARTISRQESRPTPASGWRTPINASSASWTATRKVWAARNWSAPG